MNKLRSLLRELSDADIDRSYITNTLVLFLEERGLADEAAAALEKRHGNALAEYRADLEAEGR